MYNKEGLYIIEKLQTTEQWFSACSQPARIPATVIHRDTPSVNHGCAGTCSAPHYSADCKSKCSVKTGIARSSKFLF